MCKTFAPHIVPALQELVGVRTTEVLPTLQNLFVEELQPSGSIQEGIQQFIATRQVTGHPIEVSCWDHSERDKSWKGGITQGFTKHSSPFLSQLSSSYYLLFYFAPISWHDFGHPYLIVCYVVEFEWRYRSHRVGIW